MRAARARDACRQRLIRDNHRTSHQARRPARPRGSGRPAARRVRSAPSRSSGADDPGPEPAALAALENATNLADPLIGGTDCFAQSLEVAAHA
jgi:hypothetical protein